MLQGNQRNVDSWCFDLNFDSLPWNFRNSCRILQLSRAVVCRNRRSIQTMLPDGCGQTGRCCRHRIIRHEDTLLPDGCGDHRYVAMDAMGRWINPLASFSPDGTTALGRGAVRLGGCGIDKWCVCWPRDNCRC